MPESYEANMDGRSGGQEDRLTLDFYTRLLKGESKLFFEENNCSREKSYNVYINKISEIHYCKNVCQLSVQNCIINRL